MWLKKKNPSKGADAPEKLRYSRYYEHDGILRAYADRAMVLAFLCLPTTMLALAFAVYVRLQPPTVIRVDENGQATILGVKRPGVSVTQGTGLEPTEFEKRAFVRLFLERYLNFSPTNVSRNWADSLNMMTANLRRTAYAGMQRDALANVPVYGQIDVVVCRDVAIDQVRTRRAVRAACSAQKRLVCVAVQRHFAHVRSAGAILTADRQPLQHSREKQQSRCRRPNCRVCRQHRDGK